MLIQVKTVELGFTYGNTFPIVPSTIRATLNYGANVSVTKLPVCEGLITVEVPLLPYRWGLGVGCWEERGTDG